MYFSDELRIKICKQHSINLEQYVWDNELNNYLMNIQLSPDEDLIKTMAEVYELGFNIGYCKLTSRYFAIALPKAKLAYGVLPMLKGTKRSPNGGHAWIIHNGFYIDPSLRIIIPEEIATNIGYTIEKILADSSARIIPEYDLYSNAVKDRNNDITKFNEDLFKVQ